MNKFILGSAQIGLDYGLNNPNGQINEQTSYSILNEAFDLGVDTLDTAEVYGTAHNVIGNFHKKFSTKTFKIITKLAHEVKGSFRSKVLDYLKQLRVENIYVLMFHSFHSFSANRHFLNDLLRLKNEGLVQNIGVSVYTNEEAYGLINENLISVVQLPFNLLDNHNLRGDVLQKLHDSGKTVHSRSVFLQGLFFKTENCPLPDLAEYLNKLKIIANDFNSDLLTLSLGYCEMQQNIDKIVVGIDSLTQLKENLNILRNVKLSKDCAERIDKIHVKDRNLLNPSLW